MTQPESSITPTSLVPSSHALKHMPPALIIASDAAARQGLAFLAKMYAEGRCLPDGLSQQGAVLLMVAGIDYGLSPIEAVSKLFLVGGRVAPGAHELVAQALRKGVRMEVLESTHEVATVRLSRAGHQDLTYSYGKEDAERAGLWNKKGPWANDPRSMLMAAAKRQAIRLFAPDTLSNLYDIDEITAGTGYIDTEGNFTPDPDIVGDRPKRMIKAFEGHDDEVRAEQPVPAPAPQPPIIPPPIPEEVPLPPKREAPPRPQAVVEPEVLEILEDEGGNYEDGETDLQYTDPVSVSAHVPEVPLEAPEAGAVLPKAAIIPLFRKESGEIDRGSTTRAILKSVKAAFGGDEDQAKQYVGQLVSKRGVKASKDLPIIAFLSLYKEADEFCVSKRLEAQGGFDPRVGAMTQGKGQVQDAATERDLDEEISQVYMRLAEHDLNEKADTIIADNGYSPAGKNLSAQLKMQTLRALVALEPAS